jgi:hypothetical protein
VVVIAAATEAAATGAVIAAVVIAVATGANQKSHIGARYILPLLLLMSNYIRQVFQLTDKPFP